jgi:hypothetical protein
MPEVAPRILNAKDFGLVENIRVADHVITTVFPDSRLPEKREVSLHAFVWKNEQKLPKEADQGDAVCIWGLATSAHDAVQAIPALSKNYERVACVSHPDGADATINHPDIPLNTDTFKNSGRVTLNTIQELVDRGELHPGVTVYGHSTGNPVLMEAIALDCQLTEENPHRPRLISKAVLMAPAAIINWDKVEHIKREAEKTGLQVFADEWRRAKRDRQETGRTGMKQARHILELLRKKPEPPPEPRKSLREIANNPAWKEVKLGNIAFELIERVFDKVPIFDDFRQRLHLHWPDVLPHMWSPGATADVRHNVKLVSTNCTDTARAAIKDTPIAVVLFDEDTAIPCEQFLTKEDHYSLNAMYLSDQDKRDLQKQLTRIRNNEPSHIGAMTPKDRLAKTNEDRIRRRKKTLTFEEYIDMIGRRMEHTTFALKREDKRRELIALRVKEKFPNNPNTSVEVMSWMHHAAERREMRYIDAVAERNFSEM